jgi:glycogen synthase
MRIAFISYEFPPDTGKGGIGTYVQQIASVLAFKGQDIHVFAGSSIRSINEYVSDYWLHWIQCIDGNEFRNNVVHEFEKYQNEMNFDLIESPEINSNAWEIKKKYPDLPLIVRLHGPDYLVESLKKRYIPFFAKLRFVAGALRRLRWDTGYWRTYTKETDFDYQFIQMANAVTAPSQAMKDWVIHNWHIPKDRITLLPNIFTPPPALLQMPILEEINYKKIIFFGRLNVLKGLVNASKAMKKILIEYPDWQFMIIGDDGKGPSAGISMRHWMKRKLANVINRVQFSDGINYEEIPDAIRESEIVLLPSLFESFSYTCIEAMAAGKAIVGSNKGGMKDLLQNEESGLLIDPENYNDIYNALKKLITDKELRLKVSINARKRVIAEFNPDINIEKFISFYSNIATTLN